MPIYMMKGRKHRYLIKNMLHEGSAPYKILGSQYTLRYDDLFKPYGISHFHAHTRTNLSYLCTLRPEPSQCLRRFCAFDSPTIERQNTGGHGTNERFSCFVRSVSGWHLLMVRSGIGLAGRNFGFMCLSCLLSSELACLTPHRDHTLHSGHI
jgi:hypothetical protein